MKKRDDYDLMCERSEDYSLDLENINKLYSATIRRGLLDSYDVIIADALDCLFEFGKVNNFIEEIANLCKDEQSYFVKGRVILCSAFSDNPKFLQKLRNMEFNEADEYNSIWLNVARYLKDKDDTYLMAVRMSATSSDQTKASLSQSLLASIDEGKM